jgi:polygalacturonase
MIVSRRCRMLAVAVCLAVPALAGAQTTASHENGIYDVRDYGAKGDGKTLDTSAIQAAIDACTAAGGGTVLLHGGDFLSGTIELKSNVTLRLSPSGRLLGSTQRTDYLNPDAMLKRGVGAGNGNIVLLFAANARNVTIEGRGSINGQGAAFYTGTGDGTAPRGSKSGGKPMGTADATPPNRDRPHLMVFYKCENLKIRDVFLTASAYHCVRILQCSRVDLDGVRIYNRVNKNNDGFHFNDCRYVRVSNCEVICQDDACALFGGNQFVTVTNSTFSTRWSVFRFGGGAAKNIAVSNVLIYDTYGSPIKIGAGGGSRIENLSFSNIVMENVTGPISVGFSPGRGGEGAAGSFVRNLSFDNIQATVVPLPLQHADLAFEPGIYDGEQDSTLTFNAFGSTFIENVSLSNVHITYAGGGTAAQAAKRKIPEVASEYFQVWGEAPYGPPAYGMYARNVRGLRMQNVRLDYEKDDLRPAVIFDNVQDAAVANLSVKGHPQAATALRLVNSKDVYLDAPRLLTPAPVFLEVEGASSANITLDGGDISRAGKALSTGDGVAADVVRVR